ncbi:MAG: hypothetical protein CEE38_23445 [Planctomycetes bacterium B3_Pla]|nr:MAG: hypothetical protein CEE38_23445 [Planctomycetes bacterium B3_Pla]
MAIEFQPYVGPRPFKREDKAVFFGRDREVKDLLSLVIAEGVVLIYSQSGAGKTSLFNAKLIPLLEEKGFEVLPLARVQGLIPKDMEHKEIPNIYVFNILMNWAKNEDDPKRLLRTSLADFLRELKRPTGKEGRCTPRILIFDQFEELFSSYQERWRDREKFFGQVADALDEDPLLRVVFAIREDYIAQLDPYARLLPEKLRTRYRLERLRAEAACLAVEGPLRNTKCSFEVGVASKLVRQLLNIRIESVTREKVEVAGEFVEPVQLQVVCQSLWLNLPWKVTVITSDHLQKFGDVEEALTSFYERAIETAKKKTGVSEGNLRDWFNDRLITTAGTRGTVFQGKEHTEGIPNSAVDVLDKQHIIRAEMRAGARWYELTHDRLIEPIRKSNEVWFEHERVEEQQRQIEAERQQVRIEEQAKSARLFRRLAAVLAVLFLVAIVTAVLAFSQARVAERAKEQEAAQRKIALARQLAAQAELTRNQRADMLPRSVLLAVESVRRFPSLEADQALRQGLALLAQPVATMNHEDSVLSVAFSPDGKYLATASADKTARVWEAITGEQIARMSHENSVSSVAFSPDGKYLATASRDKTARVWEAITGEQIARMNHEDSVLSVAFSPDGKYLATASWDNTARVWEAINGKEVARMNHEGHVESVAFSPDGKYLATASKDRTARVCLLWPEDLIAEASSRLTRNLTYQEWQRYLVNEPYSKTCPNLPIHPSFIEAGRDLARAGDIKGAVTIFRRAIELDPSLDLNPETEARKLAAAGVTQNGPSNESTSEIYSDVIQNFDYEATEVIKNYQREYRRFPFDDDKGEPNHTELQEYVSLVDKYIDIREKFPIQSALLWRLWGVRWLTDNMIHPKERIKLAVPFFKKSIEYHPDQEDLKTATKNLEFSITPGNEVEEGKIDGAPFVYYTMVLSKGHHSPSLEDFRLEFKEDPYRAFGVSPPSDEEIALRNDKEWLFSYATRTPIKDALAQLEREVYMKQGKRTKATIQMYRDENQYTIIKAGYPDRELKWKVDILAKRYNSLNKETEAFMLNYVHAASNTFSESFDIDGKNKPVRNFVKEEIHSYTNYALTWWLDEAAPEGLESFLAALSLSKTEFQNQEEMIGKKVDVNFVLSWLADDILEVKLNRTADIGFGPQDFNFVWHISPIKKKYVSISQDAKLYDSMVEIMKLRN